MKQSNNLIGVSEIFINYVTQKSYICYISNIKCFVSIVINCPFYLIRDDFKSSNIYFQKLILTSTLLSNLLLNYLPAYIYNLLALYDLVINLKEKTLTL